MANDDGNVIILAELRPPAPAEPIDTSVMCEITVTADGNVEIWLSDRLEAPEEFNWLFAKLAGATGNIFMEKLRRTESE